MRLSRLSVVSVEPLSAKHSYYATSAYFTSKQSEKCNLCMIRKNQMFAQQCYTWVFFPTWKCVRQRQVQVGEKQNYWIELPCPGSMPMLLLDCHMQCNWSQRNTRHWSSAVARTECYSTCASPSILISQYIYILPRTTFIYAYIIIVQKKEVIMDVDNNFNIVNIVTLDITNIFL